MFSPSIARVLVQQRQDGMLRAAALHRLRHRRDSPVLGRARVAVGRVLVTAGMRIAGRRPGEAAPAGPYPMEPITPGV